ncbi:MAG: cell division protein SepF [Clostridiales bacterium]|nr:cell division protein SepF [Clostridiales bacterium]
MIKFAEKFLNMMTLNDSEEGTDEFDEEYDEITDENNENVDYEEEEMGETPKKPILSFRRKKVEKEEEEEGTQESEGRVIPFNGRQEEGEVVKVIKPQEFNEAQIVAEFLKDGKTIVVNLEGIEISQAQRIIDFIGGASFAVDGSLKAISNNIFIVAPGNIEVSGDLRDEIISDSMLSPELTKF